MCMDEACKRRQLVIFVIKEESRKKKRKRIKMMTKKSSFILEKSQEKKRKSLEKWRERACAPHMTWKRHMYIDTRGVFILFEERKKERTTTKKKERGKKSHGIRPWLVNFVPMKDLSKKYFLLAFLPT